MERELQIDPEYIDQSLTLRHERLVIDLGENYHHVRLPNGMENIGLFSVIKDDCIQYNGNTIKHVFLSARHKEKEYDIFQGGITVYISEVIQYDDIPDIREPEPIELRTLGLGRLKPLGSITP